MVELRFESRPMWGPSPCCFTHHEDFALSPLSVASSPPECPPQKESRAHLGSGETWGCWEKRREGLGGYRHSPVSPCLWTLAPSLTNCVTGGRSYSYFILFNKNSNLARALVQMTSECTGTSGGWCLHTAKQHREAVLLGLL